MNESKMTVNITVDKNRVSVDTDTFTTGTVNNYEAVFTLPSEYNNLLLYALFDNNKCVIEEGKCILPELKNTGTLRIGVVAYDQYGGQLIERYSPMPAYARVVEGSYLEDTNTSDENLSSDYEKLLSAADTANKAAEDATLAAEDAQQTAEEIRQQAESGAFNGKDGSPGPAGPQGEKGETGPQGEKGEDGKAATITVGSVTTAQPGTSATVSNSGTPNAAVLDFVIPQGEKGDSAFTSIKPGTEKEPYIIQEYGYYCTTSVGWVQIGTNQQDISETLSIEFYKPFYCATNTIILFGFSNKYSDVSQAFTYIVTIGDDINISIYPTSGGSKEAFNYSLNEIFQNFLAFVNLFRPIIDEGQNALNKIVVVDSYDISHSTFTFSVRDADSELSDESTFAVQNKVVKSAFDEVKQEISNLKDEMYPVGRIVAFNDNDDHSAYLGFTWERYAKGRTLVGIADGDSDFGTIGNEIGEKTHILTPDEAPPIASEPKPMGVDQSAKIADPSYTGNAATGHNNIQPSKVVAFWVRTA